MQENVIVDYFIVFYTNSRFQYLLILHKDAQKTKTTIPLQVFLTYLTHLHFKAPLISNRIYIY